MQNLQIEFIQQDMKSWIILFKNYYNKFFYINSALQNQGLEETLLPCTSP